MLVMASPSSKAAVVIGQAEESEEDDDTVDPKLQKGEETKSLPQVAQTRMGDARAGLAGLRLSSVTATVERRLGSLPSIELPQWTSTGASSSKKSPPGKEEKLQHPSLLHKRLYERNQEVHADLHIFFQELFRKNEDQLENVCQSTQSSVELLQETVQCLQRSVHQANLLGERLESLDKSLSSCGLPPRPELEATDVAA